MIQRFSTGTALLAGLGLAFGLAGCNGNASGTTTTTSTGGSGESLATVGSSQVTRSDMGRFLEAQNGEQALPYLIDTQLLFEEAKAKTIEVSDADVEADLKRRGDNDPQVAQLVAKPGARADAVREQIRRDIVVQRLLTSGVTVNDAQVQSFFNKNKAYYGTPAKYKIGLLVTSTKARADIMSRALKAKTKTFEQLVAEQKKANDPIAQQSSPGGEDFQLLDAVVPSAVFGAPVVAAIEKLPKGGTSNVTPIGRPGSPPVYVIFRVTDKQPGVQPNLTALRPVVEVDAKMSQAAQAEVKKNPQNPPFDETLKRTREYLQTQNPTSGPSLRDTLTFILRPAADNLLNGLRTKGTVQITDGSYSDLAKGYQAAPAAGATGAPGATAPAGTGTAPSGATAPAGGATAPQ